MANEVNGAELTLRQKLWGKQSLRLYTLIDTINAIVSAIMLIYSAYKLISSDNADESLVLYHVLFAFGILALIAFVLSLIILCIPNYVIGAISIVLTIASMISAIVLGSLLIAQIGQIPVGVIMVILGTIALLLQGKVFVAANSSHDNVFD
nr:expressed protein [Hymenolepis microstoma]